MKFTNLIENCLIAFGKFNKYSKLATSYANWRKHKKKSFKISICKTKSEDGEKSIIKAIPNERNKNWIKRSEKKLKHNKYEEIRIWKIA